MFMYMEVTEIHFSLGVGGSTRENQIRSEGNAVHKLSSSAF
jgi:hypothetical protein